MSSPGENGGPNMRLNFLGNNSLARRASDLEGTEGAESRRGHGGRIYRRSCNMVVW